MMHGHIYIKFKQSEIFILELQQSFIWSAFVRYKLFTLPAVRGELFSLAMRFDSTAVDGHFEYKHVSFNISDGRLILMSQWQQLESGFTIAMQFYECLFLFMDNVEKPLRLEDFNRRANDTTCSWLVYYVLC